MYVILFVCLFHLCVITGDCMSVCWFCLHIAIVGGLFVNVPVDPRLPQSMCSWHQRHAQCEGKLHTCIIIYVLCGPEFGMC